MYRIPARDLEQIIVWRRAIWLACVVLMCCSFKTLADDWAFFRGPAFNGVSAETDWTADWPSSGPKVAWRTNVGIGASSIVVVGDRLVTMGSLEGKDEDAVCCLDARTGDLLWQFPYASKFDARQFEGGPASTPTVDGQFVYALGYLGQLFCLNLDDGRVVWQKDVVGDFGGRYSAWKYAGSPLVTGDLVVLDIGADGKSTIALNKKTGDLVWGAGHDLAGYATPVPFEHNGQRGVLVFKARAMVAHDLATGAELWRIGWRTNYDCNASTPTVLGDKLFISTGYGGSRARGALFQLGDQTPQQLWLNQDIETRMSSAVVHGGHLFCVSERRGGQLMCCRLSDGAIAWSESSFARFGTLMIAGDRLVILDEKGELVIASATSEEYHELARAKVLSSRSWVMPVLAGGRIFVKSNKGELVCLDVRKSNK